MYGGQICSYSTGLQKNASILQQSAGRKRILKSNSHPGSFKVIHFAISFWPTRDSISPYNIAGLISEDSEEVVTPVAKNYRCRQPHSNLTPPPIGTPANIPIHISRNENHWPTFLSLIVWVYLYSNLCIWLQKRPLFSAECVFAVQSHSRSSKVDDYGTNRKRVCDFLLVANCDHSHSLHRIWDTATYWTTPLSFGAPFPVFPLEFRAEVNHEETSHLILQWRPHDRSLIHSDTVPACDRQTVRRKESIIANTALSLASYADALSQESWAIAKMTAWCALCMGAMQIFGSPWLRPWLLFSKCLMGFCSDWGYNCACKIWSS